VEENHVKLLLIEDNPGDARLIREALREVGGERFDLQHADRLATGLARLDEGGLHLVLLDLSLPDSHGLDTVARTHAQAPDVPIVVLTGLDDEALALKALETGAQDYLVKGDADGRALSRAIRYAIERQRAEAALAAKNEEIKAMTQQLWQAARLATMGELAASVAHELNNPLGTVSLRVESLLSQMPLGDPGRRELEVVGQEVERMGTLVAHLLQFSRRGMPQVSTVDVGAEIENTLELVHYHLRQRQITVQREFAPDARMVPADRQQLRQLFLNLFTNAADAMPEGGTLTIRVYVQKAESGRQKAEDVLALPSADRRLPSVSIEVADTGTGIAPEDLPRIMEPFFTTKPEGKGTGLGLAICRRIVQEHNGTFEISSAGPGQGTTVRLTLPGKNDSREVFLPEA
jgi:signal transduction histidine kinase